MYQTKEQIYGTQSLRGHLALKSSPFKPTLNKLSSQHIIEDHMASHYYNLATIKSAIDNKPPKSTNLSIKKRDQVRRDALIKQLKQGVHSRQVDMKTKSNRTTKTLDGNKTSHLATRPLSASTIGTQNNSYKLSKKSIPRPATASTFTFQKHSTTGKMSLRNSDDNTTHKSILDLTYSGDYLDRHQDRFQNSENNPFTPRIKKRNTKSFLSQSKHYAPPTKSPKKKDGGGNYKITEKKIEAMNNLDRTSDHRKWIEEQSQYVQKLSAIEHNYVESSRSRPSTSHSETKKLIKQEEEEYLYLQFVNEVTNDILLTGVYSDNVLQHLMERHVEQRKHDLSITKMWNMLEKLKRDLGINEKKKNHSKLADTYGYSANNSHQSPMSEFSEHVAEHIVEAKSSDVKSVKKEVIKNKVQKEIKDVSASETKHRLTNAPVKSDVSLQNVPCTKHDTDSFSSLHSKKLSISSLNSDKHKDVTDNVSLKSDKKEENDNEVKPVNLDSFESIRAKARSITSLHSSSTDSMAKFKKASNSSSSLGIQKTQLDENQLDKSSVFDDINISERDGNSQHKKVFKGSKLVLNDVTDIDSVKSMKLVESSDEIKSNNFDSATNILANSHSITNLESNSSLDMSNKKKYPLSNTSSPASSVRLLRRSKRKISSHTANNYPSEKVVQQTVAATESLSKQDSFKENLFNDLTSNSSNRRPTAKPRAKPRAIPSGNFGADGSEIDTLSQKSSSSIGSRTQTTEKDSSLVKMNDQNVGNLSQKSSSFKARGKEIGHFSDQKEPLQTDFDHKDQEDISQKSSSSIGSRTQTIEKDSSLVRMNGDDADNLSQKSSISKSSRKDIGHFSDQKEPLQTDFDHKDQEVISRKSSSSIGSRTQTIEKDSSLVRMNGDDADNLSQKSSISKSSRKDIGHFSDQKEPLQTDFDHKDQEVISQKSSSSIGSRTQTIEKDSSLVRMNGDDADNLSQKSSISKSSRKDIGHFSDQKEPLQTDFDHKDQEVISQKSSSSIGSRTQTIEKDSSLVRMNGDDADNLSQKSSISKSSRKDIGHFSDQKEPLQTDFDHKDQEDISQKSSSSIGSRTQTIEKDSSIVLDEDKHELDPKSSFSIGSPTKSDRKESSIILMNGNVVDNLSQKNLPFKRRPSENNALNIGEKIAFEDKPSKIYNNDYKTNGEKDERLSKGISSNPTSQKSFLDSVRDSILEQANEKVASLDEESDYESVIALSTVLKPPYDESELISKSAKKKLPGNTTLQHETLKSLNAISSKQASDSESAVYSDNFHEESDDDNDDDDDDDAF